MRKTRKETLATTGMFHKMWQGHNGEHVLEGDYEKHKYLSFLIKTYTEKVEKDVEWHSYCLMNSHPHETGSLAYRAETKFEKSVETLGNWMRNAHSRFGASYNIRHKRKGKVSCERPKTVEAKDELGLLKTMFYGDTNPVRAGMVSHPAKYKHSSYRLYALGEKNQYTEHLVPPKAYLNLGKAPKDRQKRYRSLCYLYMRKEGIIDDRPSEEVLDPDKSIEEQWLLEMLKLAMELSQPRDGPPIIVLDGTSK
jgi:putative transposase